MAEDYAAHALALLSHAEQLGFFNLAANRTQLEKDAALQAFRGRSECRVWLATRTLAR